MEDWGLRIEDWGLRIALLLQSYMIISIQPSFPVTFFIPPPQTQIAPPPCGTEAEQLSLCPLSGDAPGYFIINFLVYARSLHIYLTTTKGEVTLANGMTADSFSSPLNMLRPFRSATIRFIGCDTSAIKFLPSSLIEVSEVLGQRRSSVAGLTED